MVAVDILKSKLRQLLMKEQFIKLSLLVFVQIGALIPFGVGALCYLCLSPVSAFQQFIISMLFLIFGTIQIIAICTAILFSILILG